MKEIQDPSSSDKSSNDQPSRLKGPSRRPRSMKEGRIWQCHLCEKAYFRSNSLKFHLSKKHAQHASLLDGEENEPKSASSSAIDHAD